MVPQKLIRKVHHSDFVSDPNFLILVRVLSKCAKKRNICNSCPQDIRRSCVHYWDTKCTGTTKGYNLTKDDVKVCLENFRKLGVLVA